MIQNYCAKRPTKKWLFFVLTHPKMGIMITNSEPLAYKQQTCKYIETFLWHFTLQKISLVSQTSPDDGSSNHTES